MFQNLNLHQEEEQERVVAAGSDGGGSDSDREVGSRDGVSSLKETDWERVGTFQRKRKALEERQKGSPLKRSSEIPQRQSTQEISA